MARRVCFVEGRHRRHRARVSIPELGIETAPGERIAVLPGALPWSAEEPRLYELVVRTPGETATGLRIGFRTVRIDWRSVRSLLVNDQPRSCSAASTATSITPTSVASLPREVTVRATNCG